MNRRGMLKFTMGATTLGASSTIPGVLHAAEPATGKPAFLFVHGAWHGAWCWTRLLPYIAAAGRLAVAIDLPGYGLNTRFPKAYFTRPLDRDAFANELSPISDVKLDDQVKAISHALDMLIAGGSGPVLLVGHSMGGMPITAAGEAVPDKIKRLVYLTALMPAPGKSLGGYFSGPEQAGSLVLGLRLDNFSKAKASRIDPRSSDPDYRATLKQAFYGDVDDASAEAAMNFLQPDSPAVGVPIATTAPRWGALPRTYIVTEQDMAVRPALQHRFIREADEAFPRTKTEIRSMESSHSPFLSKPEELAKILLELAA